MPSGESRTAHPRAARLTICAAACVQAAALLKYAILLAM